MSRRPPRRGQIIVISGPSGSGKTTIVKKLLERNPDLCRSISATTRKPRPGERDGIDYHFLSREEFERGIESGEFAEWAIYNDNYYGTPKRQLDEALREGRSILLAIEVQGAAQIKKLYPDALLIFILPPSMETLKERLRRRGTSPEEIERRAEIALKEISSIDIYDYAVVNEEGKLEEAVKAVEMIISAQSFKLTPERIEGIKRAWRGDEV